MNQQEIFEYIKKQYPATPERITQNGKQITIFKNQRNNIPYAIFYQSDESVMSIMEVQAESDKQLYRNVSPCSGKVHESETLAGSSNGWNCQRFESFRYA